VGGNAREDDVEDVVERKCCAHGVTNFVENGKFSLRAVELFFKVYYLLIVSRFHFFT